MEISLKGRSAIVTGGSKGIGLACAQAFLAEGARVTLVSRDPHNLERAKQSLHAPAGHVHTVSADLRDAAQALRALDEAEALPPGSARTCITSRTAIAATSSST